MNRAVRFIWKGCGRGAQRELLRADIGHAARGLGLWLNGMGVDGPIDIDALADADSGRVVAEAITQLMRIECLFLEIED